jgi:polysaccharide pyruvyl transferase WcaK-like protein
MHHFAVGGDDRQFNRRFAGQYLTQLDPIVENRPFSVHDILRSMLESQMCLTMRFHSTLFAHKLGAPFVAVDYTRGGKVRSFLADNRALDRLITFEQLTSGQWRGVLELVAEDGHTSD